jgi:hypothetical protein
VEIKGRIVMGNKAHHANAALFKSEPIWNNAEVIKPVVLYACATWILKEYYEEKLLASERKILRKIYGPI